MPYRFKRKQKVPQAVRRIVAEQTARAACELRGDNPDIHDGVHNARKCFKKIRSLLRLVRHAIDEDTYKAENRWFQQAAHQLAGARDAEALLETHDKLAKHKPALAEEPLTPLRENLVARREQIVEHQQDLSGCARELARKLEEVPARLDSWHFREKGFKALKKGLTDSYQHGLKEFRRAIKRPDDEHFHEWRKRVKDYWYQTRLLRQVWPELMDVRAAQLKRLSDLLGDEHDLSVMLTILEQEKDSLGPGAPVLSLLARQRQEKLRAKSETLGCRLYAMDTDCAINQMEALWETWDRGKCN
jgi:CHAD domain-containing protein